MTSLRSDLERFFRFQLPAHIAPVDLAAAICVDENLNHPELTSRLFPLLKERRLISPAWYEEREMQDGVIAHISPLKYPRLPVLRMGAPIPGSRWTDEQVIWNIVIQFVGRARVFFLSENRRGDARGIRRILERELAPILDGDNGRQLGLQTLWKKGRTSHAEYAERALAIMRTTLPPAGYSAFTI